jgi:hypothetical protein
MVTLVVVTYLVGGVAMELCSSSSYGLVLEGNIRASGSDDEGAICFLLFGDHEG